MIHLHKWKKLYDISYLRGVLSVDRTYRNCEVCGKWQRLYGSWGEDWWEDSNLPEKFGDLIDQKLCDELFKKDRMEINAKK